MLWVQQQMVLKQDLFTQKNNKSDNKEHLQDIEEEINNPTKQEDEVDTISMHGMEKVSTPQTL